MLVHRADPTEVAPAELPGRLRVVTSVGWCLAIAVGASFLSGLPYLSAKLGLHPNVALDVTDGMHLAAGTVLVVYLVAKIRLVGVRSRLDLPAVEPRARWLSAAVAGAYGGVVVTGVLALVHWPAPTRMALAQLHLILAVWASCLALWHLLSHRRLGRNAGRPALRRVGTTMVVVGATFVIPVALGAALPAAVSLPASVNAGAGWLRTGPATFVDTVVLDRAAGVVLAGGGGLYVGTDVRSTQASGGQLQWRRVGRFDSVDPVFTLLVGSVGGSSAQEVFVGAANGLFEAASPVGPFSDVAPGLSQVHAVAIDGSGSLWCTSSAGPWRFEQAEGVWQREAAGLASPATAWAMAAAGGTLYVSDVEGVYQWDGARWMRTSQQPAVQSIDHVGRTLLASSMGAGIDMLGNGRWTSVSAGLSQHSHGPVRGIHVVGVSEMSPGHEVAGLMIGGAAESGDGGLTWTPVWPQLGRFGVVWRFATYGGFVYAATDSGVFVTSLPPRRPPPWWWWPVVVSLSVLAGAISIRVVLLRSRVTKTTGRIAFDARPDRYS